MSNRSDRRRRRQHGAAELAGVDGLASVATADQQRGFTSKVGVFAAGSALAGAAVFGGTVVAPAHLGGMLSPTQQDVALTALGDGSSFADAVQNALEGLGLAKIKDLFALLGQDEDGNALFNAESPLYAATTAGDLTANPPTFDTPDLTSVLGHLTSVGDPATLLTLGGASTEFLGVSLVNPLWTAATDGTTGHVLPSLLGAGSDILMKDADGVLTSIGDLSINELVSDLLGGDVSDKTIQDLFNGLGLGGLAGFVTLLPDTDDATEYAPDLLKPDLGTGTLLASDKVSTLLGSLLGFDPTKSLGEYLTSLDWGTHGGNLAEQSLSSLTGVHPGETLAQFLAGMEVGGSVLGNPAVPLGNLDLGGLLAQLAGLDPTTDAFADTDLTGDFLVALGLFG